MTQRQLTAKEWKAIGEYAQQRDLRSALSLVASRIIFFVDRSGKEIRVPLSHIVQDVNATKAKDTQA